MRDHEVPMIGMLDDRAAWVVEAQRGKFWFLVADCESKVPEVTGWRIAGFSTRATARAHRGWLSRRHPAQRFRVQKYGPQEVACPKLW